MFKERRHLCLVRHAASSTLWIAVDEFLQLSRAIREVFFFLIRAR